MRERECEWERVERETVHEKEGDWQRVERETAREECSVVAGGAEDSAREGV